MRLLGLSRLYGCSRVACPAAMMTARRPPEAGDWRLAPKALTSSSQGIRARNLLPRLTSRISSSHRNCDKSRCFAVVLFTPSQAVVCVTGLWCSPSLLTKHRSPSVKTKFRSTLKLPIEVLCCFSQRAENSACWSPQQQNLISQKLKDSSRIYDCVNPLSPCPVLNRHSSIVREQPRVP